MSGFDWEAWLEREERRAAETREGSVVSQAAYQLMSGMVDEPHKALEDDWAKRAYCRIAWARTYGATLEERLEREAARAKRPPWVPLAVRRSSTAKVGRYLVERFRVRLGADT